MPQSAVVFDFFGTLTESVHREERDAGHVEVAAALGVPPDAYRRVLLASWPDRARGLLGGVEETLAWIARSCGVEPSESRIRRAAATRRVTQRSYLRVRPDTVSTLQELRGKRLAIGLVSDCTHELVEEWRSLPLAPLIDEPVFSVVEGIKKPDPEIYRQVCTRLGVSPGDCLYVGDGDSRELPGASAAGMRPVRLHAPDHQHAHVFDPVDWEGLTIGGLAELLEPNLLSSVA